MQTRNWRVLTFHIVGCLLFLSQPVWFSTSPPNQSVRLLEPATIRDFIANALMLAFFYLHYYVIISNLYFRRKYFQYTLCLTLGFLIIVFLPSWLTGRHHLSGGPPQESFPPDFNRNRPDKLSLPPVYSGYFDEIKHHIFLFVAMAASSLLLRIRSQLLSSEKARHAAEMANLKAQINPHFLFNTLNSIYSMAVTKNDAAADAILTLSGLMRYILRDTNADKIPLDIELEYIQNYIDLQKARLGTTVVIDYDPHLEDSNNQEIVPLILISFIENAFKHGVNPDQESTIVINISCIKNNLLLTVINHKVAADRGEDSGGIGLANTLERLKLLYADRHEVIVKEDDNKYIVHLTMNLQ